MTRRILFVSALDFKEKSIQVIRKTPEAYAEGGWSVRYIVARDTFSRGNYAYEQEISPPGVDVERFSWPLVELRNRSRGRWPLYIWTRLATLLVVLKLAHRSAKALRRESVDVIYGYEVQGVLAVRLLKLFGCIGRAKIVARFQGVCLTEMLEKRQRVRQLANLDHLVALRSRSDLTIMTDDGTRGDQVLRRLRSPAAGKLKFWVNGTDIPEDVKDADTVRGDLQVADKAVVLLSVSRLVAWKRVERGLAIASELQRYGIDFMYVIVGGGSARKALESRAEELGIADRVRFTGPVPQSDIFGYMNASDVFLSTYDMSNVGNPLLEAIRMGKLIVTLNNGDTGSWISHRQNGLIYDVNEDLPKVAAGDIARLLSNPAERRRLEFGARRLAGERLWTWRERMKAEVTEVEALLEE